MVIGSQGRAFFFNWGQSYLTLNGRLCCSYLLHFKTYKHQTLSTSFLTICCWHTSVNMWRQQSRNIRELLVSPSSLNMRASKFVNIFQCTCYWHMSIKWWWRHQSNGYDVINHVTLENCSNLLPFKTYEH